MQHSSVDISLLKYMKPIDTANREHASFKTGENVCNDVSLKSLYISGITLWKMTSKRSFLFKIVLRLLPAGKKIRNMNKAKCCKFDMLDLLSSSFVSSSLKQ